MMSHLKKKNSAPIPGMLGAVALAAVIVGVYLLDWNVDTIPEAKHVALTQFKNYCIDNRIDFGAFGQPSLIATRGDTAVFEIMSLTYLTDSLKADVGVVLGSSWSNHPKIFLSRDPEFFPKKNSVRFRVNLSYDDIK